MQCVDRMLLENIDLQIIKIGNRWLRAQSQSWLNTFSYLFLMIKQLYYYIIHNKLQNFLLFLCTKNYSHINGFNICCSMPKSFLWFANKWWIQQKSIVSIKNRWNKQQIDSSWLSQGKILLGQPFFAKGMHTSDNIAIIDRCLTINSSLYPVHYYA